MTDLEVHPSRKILLVVTTGGFTHAAPVLEIGRVLAERGHEIEFATLEGQEGWAQSDEYEFVNKVHLLGPGPDHADLDDHYRRMQEWDISKGVSKVLKSKYLWDSFWPQTYQNLKDIMSDPYSRPAFIVADFFVEAAIDIHIEYNLPIAVVGPTMPLFQLPCPYIPGQPGFQLPGTLTSENASLWLRIKNETIYFPDLPAIIKMGKWYKGLRNQNGVFRPPHKPKKPDYLLFVNSFFGLEIPRDLPPTAAPVGPLLSPTWPPLDEACKLFLVKHKSVLYIALGTHIILPHEDAAKILEGIIRLKNEGLIDGVIWAIGENCRADLDCSARFPVIKGQVKSMTLGDLMNNKNPDWLFSFFAPQRAILDNDSTKLYFTHGGGSSSNEALFHGKPMLAMGIFADQIENSTRLVAGGVAESLSKLRFSSDELYTKAKKILDPQNSSCQRNVLRLKRIAHVASRRKYHATDLIEEVMYDNELRLEDGKVLRPMHLQTADMRMPYWKAQNWDLLFLSGLTFTIVAASTWATARYAWQFCTPPIGQVPSLFHVALQSLEKLVSK